MLISVSELLKLENSEQQLNVAVDLQKISFSPLPIQFSEPVSVEGKMKNAGGVIVLSAVACGKYKTYCDRCGKEIESAIQFDVSESFVKNPAGLDDDPEATVLQGQEFDLADILEKTAFASFPTKHLCDEECKGLCPSCGMNLNERSCSCKDDEWDPRFEALRGLFD